jgi:hypothetical protein
MNTTDLKKNCKEELIIYIEKLSRDMIKTQEDNLELRRICQQQEEYILKLENDIDMLKADIRMYMDEINQKN